MTHQESVFGTLERRLVFGALCGLFAIGAMGCGPEYPNCNNDGDCHENEYCVNGQCQQCRPDGDDCAAGQECVDGRCDDIPGYCSGSGDCPSGQECVNNRCVAAQMTESTPTDTGPTACTMQTIYFGYDSSEIDSSSRSTLQSNATCIQERDIPHVTLRGHTDPRGTEEYNLALGERRAHGVRSYLQRLGVDNSRMSTHSMGEEMASGSDESSWGRDRRVEFEER